MKTWALVSVLMALAVSTGLSGTIPTITAQVNVSGGIKEYVYTLVNDLDSGHYINAFGVFMPEVGARAVTSAWSSKQGWHTSRSLRGDGSSWGCGTFLGPYLWPGDTVILKLTTSAGTPTGSNYTPPGFASNWSWNEDVRGTVYGPNDLPVPVPEPGGLIGLASGLVSGLGMFGIPLVRRRRTR